MDIENKNDWAARQIKALQLRLKKLLALHDRGDIDLGEEADKLRAEIYGPHGDSFDQPKSMAVVIDPAGERGCTYGPMLLDDVLDNYTPDFPDGYRSFIERATPDGMVRTHRWHTGRQVWVALKNRTS